MTTRRVRFGLCLFALLFSFSVRAAPATWTDLAKKVGESEEDRASVILRLRQIPSLKHKLQKALYTKDRPLALDVISALEMKELVPDLLLHVAADPDGFLTVAVNSMMDEKNRNFILKSYAENLTRPDVSNAVLVAMLEPLGRVGVVLPRATLETLRDARSPDVRASLVYYLRMMSLRHRQNENLDVLTALLKSNEFQIRLQAVSVAAEILTSVQTPPAGAPTRTELKTTCNAEKISSNKLACESFLSISARTPASTPMCEQMEKSLYRQSTIRVRMLFGYKDARPARYVGDRHERLAFIERITAACAGQSATCGFVRSHDNSDLFMKKVRINGEEHRILLWVINSSVGTDDLENRRDPFQIWKSKYAAQAFTSGLQAADVVLYDGHSRFGGGPDFSFPTLAADQSVDPTAYQSARPGLTKMIAALRSHGPLVPSKLKMLGLFSCSSSQHFSDEIHAVSRAGVVSSRALVYYADALEQSLGALNDVLLKRCPRAITF